MSRPPYYYHPRMLAYDFGPEHPFRPERLSQCTELLAHYGVETIDPGIAGRADAERAHSPEYLDALEELEGMIVRTSHGYTLDVARSELTRESPFVRFGFLSTDNPPFPNMNEASYAFIAGTVQAARDVCAGAPRSLTLAAGLHHASRERASGFCLLSDPSIAISMLLERFERVAYVDIDLHHGDGVQAIWYDDPRVLTCSIHESGDTLFPGTGYTHETGAEHTSLNIPLAAGTTGDVWIDAFRRIVPRAIERFNPGAIVLQLGSDPHYSDPLGHLNVSTQEWLEAVRVVDSWRLPLVACGGGGYNMGSVVRMWTPAILVLSGIKFDDELPHEVAERWGSRTFSDAMPPGPAGTGRAQAEQVLSWFETEFLPAMPC